jgi:hypothetical protein
LAGNGWSELGPRTEDDEATGQDSCGETLGLRSPRGAWELAKRFSEVVLTHQDRRLLGIRGAGGVGQNAFDDDGGEIVVLPGAFREGQDAIVKFGDDFLGGKMR